MKTTLAFGVALAFLAAFAASGDLLIGSPWAPPTNIDAVGHIHEAWGEVFVSLEEPSGAKAEPPAIEAAPVPTVTALQSAGPVKLTQTVYRAPIWPTGVDVLTAQVANADSKETEVQVRLNVPEQLKAGDTRGILNGRPVLSLLATPEPLRKLRPWGCTGGVTPLPGWATPKGECDPAFKNISAGMGGVPIEYRFAVAPGEKRAVVLGFCESFWGKPGQRMMDITVEGAPKAALDPIAKWGQHVPGVLAFDATDENKDGYITVVVAPQPASADQNPILNAIWVFKGPAPESAEVIAGKKSAEAECYVSVGGEKDQLLYETGPLVYKLKLAPGQQQSLTFLLAIPGAEAPNPKKTAWTLETLRHAAEEVWQGWFAKNDPKDYTKALAQ